jgi:hypothetical protein
MGYAELIDMLEKLPSEQQAEVFDFAEFLALRCRETAEHMIEDSGSGKLLADFLEHPLEVTSSFVVTRRDELYDRACLR